MESYSTGFNRLQNRESQCRFCQKTPRTRVKLSKVLKKKFLEVTQTELAEVDRLSNFLCSTCAKALKNAHAYRQKLIETQKELMKEVPIEFVPELISVKQEKIEYEEFENIVDCLDANMKEELNDTKKKGNDTKKEVNDTMGEVEIFDSFQLLNSLMDAQEEVAVEKELIPVANINCDREGCTETFWSKRMLNKHLEEVHKEAVKYRRRQAICSYCGVMLSSKKSLEQHIDL